MVAQVEFAQLNLAESSSRASRDSISNLTFSIEEFPPEEGWSSAKKTALFMLKIVIFPWGLRDLTKYTLQRLIMMPLYPAQNRIVKYFSKGERGLNANSLKIFREKCFTSLRGEGFICEHLLLCGKQGNRYSAVLVRYENHQNDLWILQAGGNTEPAEHMLHPGQGCFSGYRYALGGRCNFLAVNGPGVGLSEGTATPETMGDAQEVALRFLEEKMEAKEILIAGRSLGGAIIGQMILKHKFRSGVHYTICRQMSMDRISNVCAKIVATEFPRLEETVRKLVIWTGCELDSVEASKILMERKISEVIVQAGSIQDPTGRIAESNFQDDGIIPAEASLGRALIVDKITRCKRFVYLPNSNPEIGNHSSHQAITCLNIFVIQK